MSEYKKIGYLAVFLSGLSSGVIPVIAALLRDMDVSSIEMIFLRLLLGAGISTGLIMMINLLKTNKTQLGLQKTIQRTYFIQGLFFTLAIVSYLVSISLGTPAGEAALLIQIHPILTLILGFLILQEKISREKIYSILLALLGLIFITHPWNWESYISSAIGDCFAIGCGAFYSVYLLIGVGSTDFRKKIPSSVSITWVLVWGLITGLPVLLLLSFLPLPPNLNAFSVKTLMSLDVVGLSLLLTLFGSILPYGLVMLSNKYEIETSRQSILLLGEPVSAMLLGMFFLTELPDVWYLIGGIILIAAILVITIPPSKVQKSLAINIRNIG